MAVIDGRHFRSSVAGRATSPSRARGGYAPGVAPAAIAAALAAALAGAYVGLRRLLGQKLPAEVDVVRDGDDATAIDSSMPDFLPVLAGGRPVGRVTSACWSPRLEKNIGFAMVPVEQAAQMAAQGPLHGLGRWPLGS